MVRTAAEFLSIGEPPWVTNVAFPLAESRDKTQIAIPALAARFPRLCRQGKNPTDILAFYLGGAAAAQARTSWFDIYIAVALFIDMGLVPMGAGWIRF